MIRRSAIVNALTFSRVPLIFLWAAFAVWEEYARCGGGGTSALATLAALAMLAALAALAMRSLPA